MTREKEAPNPKRCKRRRLVSHIIISCFQGIKCILPVFREGILNGTPELKEQAAYGLGEVINLTSAAALKPSVVHITGPLIRILGDRFSWNVKVAVLETLGLLLGKVSVFCIVVVAVVVIIASENKFSKVRNISIYHIITLENASL